jgi:hypothetical protein
MATVAPPLVQSGKNSEAPWPILTIQDLAACSGCSREILGRLMVTIHNCKCGLKWQIETHDSEGTYRGRLECGICKRLIALWEFS